MVNLKIPSYVLSKFAILSAIGLMQVALFVLVLTFFERFRAADIFGISLILYLTLLAGASIGLFFSALVRSTEKAMSILPLILIPQLLLSGFLKPIDDLYVNLKENKPAVEADYERYQRDKDKEIKFDPARPNEKPVMPEPVQKSEGLRAGSYAAALIATRWTIDALAHEVSKNDHDARDQLASRMTVAKYQTVLNRESEDAIDSAYTARVRFDLLVLSVFIVFFLGLTMAALRRKDTL